MDDEKNPTPKAPTQKDALAAARNLMAKMEGVRQTLVQEMTDTAGSDAARASSEIERLQKSGAPPALIAERQRQVAGLNHMADFTATARNLQRDRGADNTVVLTGCIVDAKGKSPGEVLVRFTDAAGKELSTDRVTIDPDGNFIAEIDALKLGIAEVTATLVSPSGKPLQDEDPLTFHPTAGSVATLNATVRKRK
jgi:hypothetical protein